MVQKLEQHQDCRIKIIKRGKQCPSAEYQSQRHIVITSIYVFFLTGRCVGGEVYPVYSLLDFMHWHSPCRICFASDGQSEGLRRTVTISMKLLKSAEIC